MIREAELFLSISFLIVMALAGWVAGGIHWGPMP
jgi:hypothetical protein